MTPFLQLVAGDLKAKYGTDLSRITLVFPNKRASLFFNEYLAEAGSPIWAPRYATISELFRRFSSLEVADPIETICRIYTLYVSLTGNTSESLDFFYGWGERLLSDFDDLDKNMAPADRLFRNLQEIKQIESGEFVDEEQEKVIQKFFRDFSLERNSLIRKKFLELWNQLLPLYEQLNTSLRSDGLAYEGALYRRVTEGFESGDIQLPDGIETFAFVGFNVLDQVEERLFSFLRQQNKALFYWDYDRFYTEEGARFEAGTFLLRNLNKFPNELPAHYFSNFSEEKTIEFVAAATENIQAQAVAPWLAKHLSEDEKKTAVVLCNETLLQPVLHALPDSVKEVNVTKGFPLNHTPAYADVESFLETTDAALDGIGLLDALSEEIRRKAIASDRQLTGRKGDELLHQLYNEAYFQTYTVLNRLRNIFADGRYPIERKTLHRLLRQVLRQSSVPFHGEPAVGLQVMGVLETRNLDFENVLMLSVNEGNLPQKAGYNSFIPYNLRRAFGLTTEQHKTAVYAYYFYRLIQRARHVRLIYNTSTDGMVKGEMSRFMMQLLIEAPQLHIRHYTLQSKENLTPTTPRPVAKPTDLPQRVSRLSPSSLNTYFRCQLQFYFQSVQRLKEPPPAPDVIEPNTFGNIFHKAAELFYCDVLRENNGLVTREHLEALCEKEEEPLLMHYIDAALASDELKDTVHLEPHSIVKEVVRIYLRQLLRHDALLAPFEIKETEHRVEHPIDIRIGETMHTVVLNGSIDRLDVVPLDGRNTLRVVDYKTGGEAKPFIDMTDLFTASSKRPAYVFQTFLYAWMLHTHKFHECFGQYPIAPALFFIHKAADTDYEPYISQKIGKETHRILDFSVHANEFAEHLHRLLEEIFDPTRLFLPTDDPKICNSCPFYALCHL